LPVTRWWHIETGWDRDFAELPLAPDAQAGPRSISMASLGRHGRWGNTLFQYMFLKAFAHEYGFECEAPDWPGQRFFGHRDRPLTRHHQVVLRDNMSLISESANNILAPIDGEVNRVATLMERGRAVYLLNQLKIANDASELPFIHADLEGLFIVHTHYLAPYREYLRNLLRPVPRLADELRRAIVKIRSLGKTIVGVHIRRGDFDRCFSAQGFEFVAPLDWYHRWLDDLWQRVEDPVLLICSDDPDMAARFARYKTIGANSLEVALPRELVADLPVPWQREVEYFRDWLLLTQCDRLAISNSTFSFSAAMMNERCTEFVRPDPDRKTLVPFDPWNAEPLIMLKHHATAPGELVYRLRLARAGLGNEVIVPGIERSLRTWVRILLNRAGAARYFHGRRGLMRELVTPAFYLASRRHYDSINECGYYPLRSRPAREAPT
ncbi:MAG TPA: alpha-1,2-fucosyltransferase, partial [Candidatus Binataceae bacterium]|nr:alpha-1,2-fucosyltransferase [Candidatus Binataceae bacterium]